MLFLKLGQDSLERFVSTKSSSSGGDHIRTDVRSAGHSWGVECGGHSAATLSCWMPSSPVIIIAGCLQVHGCSLQNLLSWKLMEQLASQLPEGVKGGLM